MSLARRCWTVTRATALWGFALGGMRGIAEYAEREHVREFQAGDPSGWAERALAMAQRAAIEGLGFATLALLLVLASALLAPLWDRRWRPSGPWPVDTRAAASLVRVLFGLVLWICFGAWLAREALPFLDLPAVLLLDLLGIGAGIALLWLFESLARRLPGAAGAEPLGRASACALALGLCLRFAWLALSQGERGVLEWSVALACGPLALVLARQGMRNLCAAMPALAWSCLEVRFAPRALFATLGLLLAGCTLATLARLELDPSSSLPPAQVLAPRTPLASGPNVVMITVDTLRADALSCYGYPRPTTPFLDRLAAEGTRVADVSAAASWTKPSTGTLLTGLYPSRHGALYHGSQLRTPAGGSTLAEAFQAAGYVTAGFVSNPNIKAVFGFDRGFDLWFDAPAEDTLTLAAIRDSLFGQLLYELTRYQFNWKYANDSAALNARILPWLEANREQRFFLYLHYIDPHEPYAPPAEYRERFAQEHGLVTFNARKRLVGRDLYDAEIRYTDDQLAALEQTLKAQGLDANTLLVLTSDHGEEFFEHGALGHGFSLFQEVVQVPLIFHGPGVMRGKLLEEPVATRDLAATVLDLAGTGVTQLGDGTSFAQALRATQMPLEPAMLFLESEFGESERDLRSFVFSGVREGCYKLVLTEADGYHPVGPEGRQALFDLCLDPGETRDLLHDPLQHERVERLLQSLSQHSQMLQETGFRDVPSLLLSPEIRASLEALGYL